MAVAWHHRGCPMPGPLSLPYLAAPSAAPGLDQAPLDAAPTTPTVASDRTRAPRPRESTDARRSTTGPPDHLAAPHAPTARQRPHGHARAAPASPLPPCAESTVRRPRAYKSAAAQIRPHLTLIRPRFTSSTLSTPQCTSRRAWTLLCSFCTPRPPVTLRRSEVDIHPQPCCCSLSLPLSCFASSPEPSPYSPAPLRSFFRAQDRPRELAVDVCIRGGQLAAADEPHRPATYNSARDLLRRPPTSPPSIPAGRYLPRPPPLRLCLSPRREVEGDRGP